MRLLLTRPAADSAPLARELEAAGHRVLVAPLMAIEGLAGAALDLDGVQALLATSSNAVRAIAAHERAAAARALPLFAVGDATARSAREAGFGEVHAAGGDVEKLADLVREQLVPGNGRLVHVAGRERAGDLKGALAAQGFDVEVAVLYRAEAAGKLAAPVLAALGAGTLDGVLLFSPRTARIWAGLVVRSGLAKSARALRHYCLSPAVAEALAPLELPFGSVATALLPRQDDLLRLIGKDDGGTGGGTKRAPARKRGPDVV